MRAANAMAVARRLNEAELVTLRELVQQQHAEIERLKAELASAELAAEHWRHEAFEQLHAACADGRHQPGLTVDGALMRVLAAGLG